MHTSYPGCIYPLASWIDQQSSVYRGYILRFLVFKNKHVALWWYKVSHIQFHTSGQVYIVVRSQFTRYSFGAGGMMIRNRTKKSASFLSDTLLRYCRFSVQVASVWSLPGRIPNGRMWVKMWGNEGLLGHKAWGEEKRRQTPEGTGFQGADIRGWRHQLAAVARDALHPRPSVPGDTPVPANHIWVSHRPDPPPFPPATSPAPILLIPHVWDFKSIQDPPTDRVHAHLNSREFLLQVVLSLQYWSLIASKTFQCHVLFACLFVSLNHDW